MPALTLPPILPLSLSATVARWRKKVGEFVAAGDVIVELEGEEATIHVESECAGRLIEILAAPGKTLRSGDELARIDAEATGTTRSKTESQVSKETQVSETSATVSGKVTPVLMPQAGNTMEEGTVIGWHVTPGEQVAVGQILCEIETDKATMDFESPDAGRLARIVAKEGEPVAVKGLIALLADNDADADAYLVGHGKTSSNSTSDTAQSTSATAGSAPSNGSTAKRTLAPAPVSAEGRIKASPAARRLATERGIELSAVGAGSGPGGRILSSDLAAAATLATVAAQSNGSEIRRPISKMRRAIGLNLQQSKQTVPHFYVRATIDADPLLSFYRGQKSAANCTLNDIIIFAVGRAIGEFPALRSQIVGNEIVEYPHANIGIAVGIDDGLVVPVVTDVDTLSLAKLAAETKRVVDAARKGRLENIGKGHFTISNLGMFGVEEFSAIINPPESGILAVSAAREAVIVENGAMRAGRNMTLTLSADHRLIDGVMAAKFMQRLREILEHPAEALS
jgi:pyruvate dehydrogenase E2 component (dihydrolipoamide acetyltransferase)